MPMPEPRIVTLLPAATEIVCRLGLRGRLVGRSHECDYPQDVSELPALTRSRLAAGLDSAGIDSAVRELTQSSQPIYEIDEEGLVECQPSVVVTQEACEVCAVSYEQVAAVIARAIPRTRIVSLGPERLDDVLQDVVRVAETCGVAEVGDSVLRELRGRLTSLSGPAQRPRIAVIEWLDPPMLAGHWVPDTIDAAGGEAVGVAPGAPSPYVSWNEIAALRSERILVAPCGFDLETSRGGKYLIRNK